MSDAPIPETAPRPRVLVVLPCYNEAASVAEVLREIKAVGAGLDTIVIDDGSRDQTYAVAAALSATVRLAVNLGIGGAMQTGIRYAERNDYDFCVQVDGDGQHPPDQVSVLLAAYREEPVNILIGSRFLRNDSFVSTFARRSGARLISHTLRLLFGQRVTDPTSGLRLFDRRAIELFAHSYPADFPEPISLAVAMRSALTLREVPIQMRPRKIGKTSIAGLKPLSYMIRVLGYIVLTRFSRLA